MSERGRRRRRRLRLPATRETGRGRGERIEWRIGAGSDRNECDEGCDAGHSTIGGETHDREAGAGDVADGIECVGRAEGANLQLPLSTRVPSTRAAPTNARRASSSGWARRLRTQMGSELMGSELMGSEPIGSDPISSDPIFSPAGGAGPRYSVLDYSLLQWECSQTVAPAWSFSKNAVVSSSGSASSSSRMRSANRR